MITLPLFYHPTTIMILDDDTNLLAAMKACINTGDKILTFSSTKEMANFIDNHSSYYEKKKFIRGITDDDNYEDIHHAPSDFDITTLAEIHNNIERLNEISTLILDYEMPGKNGLDFSKDYQRQSFNKVLLTGKAIESEIIEAFNSKLIDKYIEKGTAEISKKLNDYIYELTRLWFIRASSPIRACLETEKKLPIDDCIFIEYFQKFCYENGIIEFYLIDKVGSYLCYDNSEKSKIFLVHTNASLDRWLELNEEKSSVIIDTVKARENIPFFGVGRESWQVPENLWEKCLYIPKIIDGKEKYYISIIDNIEG